MMFSKKLILIIVAVAMVLGGSVALAQTGYKVISTTELQQWMDQSDRPLLIFALSPIEFSMGHIPNSSCIPLELMDNYYKMPEDLNQPIVFYCKGPGCVKSRYAAGKASDMGYTNIYWYRGGIKEWKEAGLPLGTTINIMQHEQVAGISPKDLKQQLDSKEQVFLLDIRDETSRTEFGAIPGKNLQYPLYRLHRLYKELPRNKKIVIYDIRGIQAPVALQYLLSVHFDPANISWLDGGVTNWKSSGFPVNQQQE